MSREWPDGVIEGLARAICVVQNGDPDEYEGGTTPAWHDYIREATAALSAAADALEGAIRAEVLAPIVALVIKADAEVAGKMWQVAQVRADAIDSVIADPDAIAKHNAAIWDEGARAVINAGSVLTDMPSNPYRTTEPTP